ncbi:hypothetical protein ACQJBY_007087 [Aegilops geniculata]
MNPPPFWSRKPIHRSPSGRARPPSWIHRVDPPPPSPLNPSDAFAFVDPLSSSRIHLFLLRCCPSAPHVGIDLIQHAYLVGAPDSSSATWSCRLHGALQHAGSREAGLHPQEGQAQRRHVRQIAG